MEPPHLRRGVERERVRVVAVLQQVLVGAGRLLGGPVDLLHAAAGDGGKTKKKTETKAIWTVRGE